MSENVLKGVFKEGTLVASVIQKDESARIMLKGAEPGRPNFKQDLQKVSEGCKPHVEKFSERELCAVLIENPGGAEGAELSMEDLQTFGLTKISLMDGNCGIVVRVVEAEPAPTALAYTSLRSDTGLPDQPGMAEIPTTIAR